VHATVVELQPEAPIATDTDVEEQP
jgi:hypothetical protein